MDGDYRTVGLVGQRGETTHPPLRGPKAHKGSERCELEVDGGINTETAPKVVAAGANVLVAGEAIFGAEEGIAGAMRRIRESIEEWLEATS